MAEVYRVFAHEWRHVLDFSDQALIELYNHESYGTPCCQKNGYLWGKRWLNVNVAMWREDIEGGFLLRSELYDDPRFPSWWLDGVLR